MMKERSDCSEAITYKCETIPWTNRRRKGGIITSFIHSNLRHGSVTVLCCRETSCGPIRMETCVFCCGASQSTAEQNGHFEVGRVVCGMLMIGAASVAQTMQLALCYNVFDRMHGWYRVAIASPSEEPQENCM